MNLRKLIWALPLLTIPHGLALANWTARDSAGATITFNALAPGGTVLPKHVVVDSTGANVASVNSSGALKVDTGGGVQPSSQSGTWTVGIGSAIPAGTNVIGAVTQSGSPWGTNLTQYGGTNLTSGNPLPAQLSLSNVPVASGNPLPISCISGCTQALGDSAFLTYSAASGATTPHSSIGDVSCLAGSATKTIRVRKLRVAVQGATNTNTPYALYRRSTANTGGSPTTLTAVRHDTADVAATVAPVVYSALPTSGTSVGRIADLPLYVGGAPSYSELLEFGSAVRGDKTLVLRGTSESVCVRQESAVGVGFWATWEWTEE